MTPTLTRVEPGLKVHFIGIGGIGISALAKYLLAAGARITGSDLCDSDVVRDLRELGVEITIGPHSAAALESDVEVVIRNTSIQRGNPELEEALARRSTRVMTTAQGIAEAFSAYDMIAVSGTHGKSTTTSLISLALMKAGFDPTVIVGTKLREFGGSNFRQGSRIDGRRPILIIEACEYAAAFLDYRPHIAVIMNIEPDHLDFYGDIPNLCEGFRRFLLNVKSEGVVIANSEDSQVSTILPPRRIVQFSSHEPEMAALRDMLRIPGDFNAMNALAALHVTRELGIPDTIAFAAFCEFEGAWRRFQVSEIVGPPQYTLVDDYAHHPTALAVTMQAARDRWASRRIRVVYQPHQASRTASLMGAYIETLRRAPVDEIIIAQTYDPPGRDIRPDCPKVDSDELVKRVWTKDPPSAAHVIRSSVEIYDYLTRTIAARDVIMIIGAGNIYAISERLRNSEGIPHGVERGD